MGITGLHHITLVCREAQRTVDFYTEILGLRLVKQTVNFDDPSSYHLYFGNETGAPGSAITFFEWPGAARGWPGIGGTHHFALQVPDGDGLRQWKRYLIDRGIAVVGPVDRSAFEAITFNDPDGTVIEIATIGPGWARAAPPTSVAAWRDPVPAILPSMALTRGIHHVTAIAADLDRTDRFLGGILGLRRIHLGQDLDDPTSRHWYWGDHAGAPGTLVSYLERDPMKERRARFGAGQTHHFAVAVTDEVDQLAYRERLLAAGLRVSPVMDRIYFKSIYTQDPDGHIVELATLGPGFQVDESPALLGTTLQLPPWLEERRGEIAARLTPIRAGL